MIGFCHVKKGNVSGFVPFWPRTEAFSGVRINTLIVSEREYLRKIQDNRWIP